VNSESTYKAHVTAEQLKEFINGHDSKREWVEEHIQQCESCLMLFIRELDVTEQQPARLDWNELENNVMTAIHNETFAASSVQRQPAASKPDIARPRPRSTWFRHPTFHYSLAASITLLLLVTGALDGLSQQVSYISEHAKSNYAMERETSSRAPWSEEVMSKTSQWLDGIQEYRFK